MSQRSSRFRHVSRKLELGPDNRETDCLDDGLTSVVTLNFADHSWTITAHAANRVIYPAWESDNLWIPLGVMLLSLGLAWFLFRSAQREKERTHLLAFQTALLNSIPNPIFVKNVAAVFTACNKAYEHALGIDRESIIGKTELDVDYMSAALQKAAHEDDVRLIREGGYTQQETSRSYADGAVHNVVYWRTTFEVDDGMPGGMIGGLFDITELKMLQDDLEQAKVAADAANQAKSAFLANMSHELRTPMNAILGYSEMLMEEAEDVGQDDFIPDLKKINQAGNHLLSLINDVLDLSKIESGKMETFAEVFDVEGLVDQIAGTAQPLMAKNNNHFKIERGENLGNACQDITKLRQSLLNMLSNAAKFTHEGTITLRVEREHAGEVEWLTFAVNDSGIGIPADKLDHVFEEFSQADNSTTRDYGGTGLGLTISRRFCQMLGGDMTVTSELGVGSTFTIRLPAVLPDAGTPQDEPSHPATGVERTSADVHQPMSSSAILVIDDDAEASEIIRRFLEKDGFYVVTAPSGEQGLRLAHEIHPTAITLDIMMPEMDGWSVLRALKADPATQSIPVSL